MRLYLVQHARALSEEEDPDRPLTDEGWRDITSVAQFLSKHECVNVTRIFHSGKTRAEQTASVIARYCPPLRSMGYIDGLQPNDPPEVFLEALGCSDNDAMAVGHLPVLARIASKLINGDPEKPVVWFSMGGVVCLERDEKMGWGVEWIVVPEMFL